MGRKAIGNLAKMLLESYMKKSALEDQNRLIAEREEANDLRAQGDRALQDPTRLIAAAMAKSGIKQAGNANIESLVPNPDATLMQPFMEQVQKANTPADAQSLDLDSYTSAMGITPATPIGEGPDPTRVMQETPETFTARAAQMDRGQALRGEDERKVGIQELLSRAGARGTGLGKEDADASNFGAQFAREWQTLPFVEAKAKSQAYGSGMGQEQVESETFNDALLRKVRLESAISPIMAQRAAAESFARLPAQLELEERKNVMELAAIGKREEAKQVSERNAAVKNLLPIYGEYRKLAVEVANSWAGAGTPVAGGALNVVGKTPIIGGMLEAAAESAHGAVVNAADPALSKRVTELNRITDTLAQGMANAVIGNRGQTTENDRRTAKNILSSSFTDAGTLQDLLAITDRMFTLLTTVTGEMVAQDPFASASQILEAAAARAKAETQAATPGLTPNLNQRLNGRPN